VIGLAGDAGSGFIFRARDRPTAGALMWKLGGRQAALKNFAKKEINPSVFNDLSATPSQIGEILRLTPELAVTTKEINSLMAASGIG